MTAKDLDEVMQTLLTGEIELLGQLANSSNETFLVEGTHPTRPEVQHWAIYKPELGERPLRDFPPGLHHRERVAYLLSAFLGWDLVPPTVIREEAPFGLGSLQLFVEHDPHEHYFTLMPEHLPESAGTGCMLYQLRRLALFDLIVNNADRKAGHVLRGPDDRLWGIDHGLCFSAPFKLRTVIWDFADEDIDDELLDDMTPLADEVPDEISEHLSWFEIEALQARVRQLLMFPQFPDDPTGMRFPWPLI